MVLSHDSERLSWLYNFTPFSILGDIEIERDCCFFSVVVLVLTDGTRRHRLLKHKYIWTSSIKSVSFSGPHIIPWDPSSDIETVSVARERKMKRNKKKKSLISLVEMWQSIFGTFDYMTWWSWTMIFRHRHGHRSVDENQLNINCNTTNTFSFLFYFVSWACVFGKRNPSQNHINHSMNEYFRLAICCHNQLRWTNTFLHKSSSVCLVFGRRLHCLFRNCTS